MGLRSREEQSGPGVEGYGGGEDQALDHVLPLRRGAEQVEAVADHLQEERADHRPPDRSLASEQRRPAEHDRRDRIELDPLVRVPLRRLHLREQDHARDARREAGDREGRGTDDADAHARQASRFRVSAGRIDVPAERRAREDEAAEEREREPDEDRVVDPPGAAEAEDRPAVGLDRDEVAARHDLREAVDDDRGGERGDERVHLADRDQEPVPDPAAEAHEAPEDERSPDSDARVQENLAGDDRAEPGDGADREIEPARDEYERPADRDDPDRRRLEGEVLQVRRRAERAARDGERDAARVERDPASRHHAARPVGGESAANAARSTASSLMDAWSNSATIAPARITSTRCARPRTSSCADEMSRIAMPSAARPCSSS